MNASAVRYCCLRVLEAATIVATLFPASATWALPGDLDLTFGGGGIVATDVSPNNDQASGVALQSDGKIVAVGTAGGFGFGLARYHPTGSLDAGFGNNGIATTAIGTIPLGANAVVVQADDKVVAAGGTFVAGSTIAIAVARYNHDGTLDAGFGNGGTLTKAIGSLSSARAVAADLNGNIIAAGISRPSSGSPFVFTLLRLSPDGTPDSTFGNNGVSLTSIQSSMDANAGDEAHAIAVQSDGKVVTAGQTRETSDSEAIALTRHDSSGALDPSFGGDGIVVTAVGTSSTARALDLQVDGKIVIAGCARSTAEEACEFAVLRYDPDGALDASFGVSGVVTTPIAPTGATALAIAVQEDGKIVVAGHASETGFVLVRYDESGALDATFGGDGIVTTSIGTSSAALAVTIQPDGRIVAGGKADADARFALARYEGQVCGNEILEPSEQCDDGNRLGGDGCDSTCQLEPTPTPTATATPTATSTLTATVTVTTTPSLTATATPTLTPTTSPTATNTETPVPTPTATPGVCGDEIVDQDEECDDGNLEADDGCSMTCTLEPCLAEPIQDCVEAARAQLWSNEKTVGRERLKLQWKRVVRATTQGVFGDPVNGATRVAVCLYDDSGALVRGFVVDQGGQSCSGKPCWVAKGTKGYAYNDKATASDGIGRIGYRAGEAGKGKVDAAGANKAAKAQTGLPTGVVAALSGNMHPTIQLVTSGGFCVGATMTDVTLDDGLQYKARKK